MGFQPTNHRQERIERWSLRNLQTLSKAKEINETQRATDHLTRRLHKDLLKLGENRERLIEQSDYTQKVFATKQAIRFKEKGTFLKFVQNGNDFSLENFFLFSKHVELRSAMLSKS